MKFSFLSLKLGIGGPFHSILTEFLSARVQSIEMLIWMYHREVYLALYFSYSHDMWFGLENTLVSYADDATIGS